MMILEGFLGCGGLVEVCLGFLVFLQCVVAKNRL
jgi:hypothetical protein